MAETELISLFDKNINDFLSNLKTAVPKYKKRAEDYEKEIKNGKLMECITIYNESIKKYEKRFFKKDQEVIKRIANPLFSALNMHKLMMGIKEETRETIWEYLKSLYMYSELIVNKEREDMLNLVKECTPKEDGKEIDDIDGKISQATEVISNMFGGDEMSGFGDLIKEVGVQIGSQIKMNGGEIDTTSVMESFSKMMKGEDIGQMIGGIDMTKVIENASKKVEKQVESGELDVEKLKEQTNEKMMKLLQNTDLKK